jgi:ribosomal protein S11
MNVLASKTWLAIRTLVDLTCYRYMVARINADMLNLVDSSTWQHRLFHGCFCVTFFYGMFFLEASPRFTWYGNYHGVECHTFTRRYMLRLSSLWIGSRINNSFAVYRDLTAQVSTSAGSLGLEKAQRKHPFAINDLVLLFLSTPERSHGVTVILCNDFHLVRSEVFRFVYRKGVTVSSFFHKTNARCGGTRPRKYPRR